MNIFKFRVIIDTEEDVFRDIEIGTEVSFRNFHENILKAFEWKEGEMASFYLSNEMWEKGAEIPLMDMDELEKKEGSINMSNSKLCDFISKPDEKIIYVYDFLRMWCFYIELISVKKAAPGILYPNLSLSYGISPDIDSKEIDLFSEGMFMDDTDGKEKIELTGDPEIDAYLLDDGLDDFDENNFESLDGLDEFM